MSKVVGFHGIPVGECQRCGKMDELFDEGVQNYDGKWVTLKVCWDCSFTILNNLGDPFDASEDEEEEDFEL